MDGGVRPVVAELRDFTRFLRNDSQRRPDRCARLVAARPALGAVGRVVLLQWRGAARAAAVHARAVARAAGRHDPAAGALRAATAVSEGVDGLEAVLPHRLVQQCAAVLADRHRTDLHPERVGFDPQCHHAAVHGGGDGGGGRGEARHQAGGRCDRRPCRRRDPSRQRTWTLPAGRGSASCCVSRRR